MLIIEKLAWDSSHFGFNIGAIKSSYLDESNWLIANTFIENQNIKLIYFNCDTSHRPSVQVAEKAGFSFVDIRVELFLDFTKKACGNRKPIELPNGFVIVRANEADFESLLPICNKNFVHSRYYYDDGFDREKVDAFYVNWLKKSLVGQFDDDVFALRRGDVIYAMCSISFMEKGQVSIGLFSVHPAYTGKGFGKLLLQWIVERYKNSGKMGITVVTQGRNISAQNLYFGACFRSTKIKIYYHLWR